jgi:hypothetical protein
MYEPIHTRQTAELEVAIWIDPDERLSIYVTDASRNFTLPARDGTTRSRSSGTPTPYQPRKEA